jgi:HTH-type transcriptional regulator/antitoxin HigA
MATKTWQPHHSDLAIHPGEVLAEELEARAMTQRALAEAIGRPEQVVSEIIHGKKGITAETALQLSDVFGVSAELWMNLQASYALTVARRSAGAKRAKAKRTVRNRKRGAAIP